MQIVPCFAAAENCKVVLQYSMHSNPPPVPWNHRPSIYRIPSFVLHLPRIISQRADWGHCSLPTGGDWKFFKNHQIPLKHWDTIWKKTCWKSEMSKSVKNKCKPRNSIFSAVLNRDDSSKSKSPIQFSFCLYRPHLWNSLVKDSQFPAVFRRKTWSEFPESSLFLNISSTYSMWFNTSIFCFLPSAWWKAALLQLPFWFFKCLVLFLPKQYLVEL